MFVWYARNITACTLSASLQVDREVDPHLVCEGRSKEYFDQIRSILSQRTESEKATLRTLYGVRETSNPLLYIPADLYQ